jgi:TonB family protein
MRLRGVLLAGWLIAGPAWPQAAEDTPRAAGTEVPAPKRTRFVSPQYPADAQARGLRGIVILELIIDTAGKVASATVTRSVPPFDEAALVAARQWEYEVTKVGGKPVTVRLSVPITFTMPVPRVTRQQGIPELIQGVNPGFPAGEDARGEVVAELTVEESGQVTEIEIQSGATRYADALMDALRTWRFAPGSDEGTMAFRVEADFVPASAGGPKVELRLAGLRRSETIAEAAPAPEPVPAASPEPAATTEPRPAPPAEALPAPAPVPAPTSDPAPPSQTAVETGTAPASGPGQPPPPPPIEVLGPVSAAPAAPPPTAAPVELPPVSAIRDVTLTPGVPDLTRGRRPVVPPLARMSSATGTVEVRFAVDASGASSVQEVSGPDILKEAARQAVGSWVFRRTSAERLHLVAAIVYGAATATATVRRDE